MFRFVSLVSLSGAALLGPALSPALGQELFREDFDGNTFDHSKWNVADWTFAGNRSYFGHAPEVSGGTGRLLLDTYNPNRPGTHFLGTEIFTKHEFELNQGLEFEVRGRLRPTPGGVVVGLFTHGRDPENFEVFDEIDFEILTNRVSASGPEGDPLQLTTWDDFVFGESPFNTLPFNQTAEVEIDGLDLHDFNTTTIRWYPDHVEWWVNGERVRASSDVSPDLDTPFRLNFWAANELWQAAYNAELEVAGSAAENQRFEYEVDHVVVRAIPSPGAGACLLSAAAALVLRRHSRQRLQNTSGGA